MCIRDSYEGEWGVLDMYYYTDCAVLGSLSGRIGADLHEWYLSLIHIFTLDGDVAAVTAGLMGVIVFVSI